MVTMYKIMYFLKESLSSARANLGTTIGGIVTIFLSLLMVGISILFSAMINNVTDAIEDDVNIRLYISDSAKDKQITELQTWLESLENEQGNVKSVTFLNKDQVLEEFKSQTSGSAEIAETLDGNPLPRTFVIEMIDTQRVEELANNILNNDTFKSICDKTDDPSKSIKYGQGTVDRLFTVINIIRYACIVAIILLIFISLVFLNNTIRLAILARRKEISIMRLVGASNGFIRGPFIMEGALQALIGAVLAIIVISILRVTAIPSLENTVSFLSLAVSGGTYGLVYFIMIIAGLLVGTLGSFIAMRRYLKV